MTAPIRRFARRLGRLPPPLILALLYAVLIVAGAVLLMLPAARTVPITWSDAVFTSASAVTVTGLVVIDTGADLTIFGQAVVAFLIQMGGLGLMTFAVLILAALGLPVGITGKIFLRDDLNQTSISQLSQLVLTIFKVVVICELMGAALLALVFVPEYGFWRGLWESVFHSISAFNNAGFSTFPNGLVPYATNAIVNIVIPALFIIGGIGYVVLHDVFSTKRWRAWSLHTKIMLVGTAILIPWSVGMFALLEWTNPGTLGQFDSIAAKLTVSWFPRG